MDQCKQPERLSQARWRTACLLEDAFGLILLQLAPNTPYDPDRLTSDIRYIRLHGRRRWYADSYSAKELEEIAQLAGRLGERGAKKVYVFFNNDFDANAVKTRWIL